MLQHAIILSLQITAIYVVLQQGMLLGWLRIGIENKLDDVCIFFSKKLKKSQPLSSGKQTSKFFQKPVWGCLTCMGSLWTIILTWSFNLPLILVVCGINALIDKFLDYD